MKRKLLSVILSFLFVFSMAISVSASADGIEDGSTTISPRAHDVEAKRELVNTQTLVKHPLVTLRDNLLMAQYFLLMAADFIGSMEVLVIL